MDVQSDNCYHIQTKLKCSEEKSIGWFQDYWKLDFKGFLPNGDICMFTSIPFIQAVFKCTYDHGTIKRAYYSPILWRFLLTKLISVSFHC